METVKLLNTAKRVVIKIGSATLVDSDSGRLNTNWLRGLAVDISNIKKSDADVLIVSSGAIALGRGLLGLPKHTLSLEQSQAAAAVGQICLAQAFSEALVPHALTAAQILLTLEDSENRKRYLNGRSTFATLLAQGAVPIVNENDTVATNEIRFGDNDRLAAQVAVMTGADLLILLSDVDGYYDKNPMIHDDAQHFEFIKEITPEIEAMAGAADNYTSKGGMRTKILAAKTATSAGCTMIIAKGTDDRPISMLRSGARCTVFAAERDPQTARKHWISSMKPRGSVRVDNGARAAMQTGKSLLPAGVHSVTGEFGRGDPVEIVGPNGESLGKGLIRYTKPEALKILGHKSHEILSILGYPARAAMIHRDDMAS